MGSSGESTVLSSTPFSPPAAGSGALRHACKERSVLAAAQTADDKGACLSYLDEVLALRFGDKRLELGGGEGIH